MKKNKSSIIVQDVLPPPIKSSSVSDINLGTNKDYRKNFQINVQYSNRFVGEWQEECYKVTRKYINTKINGIKLFTTYCTPLKPYATFVILHGYGDHSGRYMHLADEFAKNGFEAILYDQRGFGQSGGIRGTQSIDDMHQDLEMILRTIERSHPIFLYCQSYGAAIGLSFCLANPTLNIQGVIVVNAHLQLAKKYGMMKKLLLQLANTFIPGLMINSYMDYAHCSKNNYIIRSWAEDQLTIPIMSIKMAHNFLQFDKYILPNAHKLTQPILIIHGKEDKVASHMNSVELYRQIGAINKTLKLFEKGFHEMQNDVEFERLVNTVINWSSKQVLKDKRVCYIRQLNHGIKVQNPQTKYLIFQLILLYFLLRNKLGKLGKLGKIICTLALGIASFIIHLRW